MARVRAVVGMGLILIGARVRAIESARTGARMARRRQGNWRKDNSGAWFQMNVVRGVSRRVMVMVRMASEARKYAGTGFKRLLCGERVVGEIFWLREEDGRALRDAHISESRYGA